MLEINIKKIFKKLFQRRVYSYSHNIFNPQRDWATIFIVFSISLLGVGIFNFYIFYQINQGSGFLIESLLTRVETIDRTTLRTIIDVFEERSEKLSDLQLNKPASTDPTL